MYIDREEVIIKLCELATEVGKTKFKYLLAHDCFCSERSGNDKDFRFDEDVLDYIVESVNMRLRGDCGKDL